MAVSGFTICSALICFASLLGCKDEIPSVMLVQKISPVTCVEGDEIQIRGQKNFSGTVIILPSCDSCSARGLDLSELNVPRAGSQLVFATRNSMQRYRESIPTAVIYDLALLSVPGRHLEGPLRLSVRNERIVSVSQSLNLEEDR
jgi:hypothetical protein